MDDIIITGTNLAEITNFKEYIHSVFGIKDIGYLHYFLGFEVGYTSYGITLIQAKFTKELLACSGISQFKKVATPLSLNLKLHSDSDDIFPDQLSTGV